MAQTGRDERRQAVYNGYLPDDNQPYIIPVDYDFSTFATTQEDLTVGQMNGTLPFVQTCFIDNSDNPSPLAVYINGSDYTLRVPSGGQGVYPIYAPNGPFQPRLTTVAGNGISGLPLKVRVNWCNFQQPIGQWAAA